MTYNQVLSGRQGASNYFLRSNMRHQTSGHSSPELRQRIRLNIPVRTLVVSLTVLLLLGVSFRWSSAEQPVLPQDTGWSGLKQELQKLRTTARLMHTTAHPDDEDATMLTFEARGQGADVLLFTLNRGEGGQNKTGSGLFDALGILRTEELLAADNYYGVEQRFSRVAD